MLLLLNGIIMIIIYRRRSNASTIRVVYTIHESISQMKNTNRQFRSGHNQPYQFKWGSLAWQLSQYERPEHLFLNVYITERYVEQYYTVAGVAKLY